MTQRCCARNARPRLSFPVSEAILWMLCGGLSASLTAWSSPEWFSHWGQPSGRGAARMEYTQCNVSWDRRSSTDSGGNSRWKMESWAQPGVAPHPARVDLLTHTVRTRSSARHPRDGFRRTSSRTGAGVESLATQCGSHVSRSSVPEKLLRQYLRANVRQVGAKMDCGGAAAPVGYK